MDNNKESKKKYIMVSFFNRYFYILKFFIPQEYYIKIKELFRATSIQFRSLSKCLLFSCCFVASLPLCLLLTVRTLFVYSSNPNIYCVSGFCEEDYEEYFPLFHFKIVPVVSKQFRSGLMYI